jgi:hypothetical protein
MHWQERLLDRLQQISLVRLSAGLLLERHRWPRMLWRFWVQPLLLAFWQLLLLHWLVLLVDCLVLRFLHSKPLL